MVFFVYIKKKLIVMISYNCYINWNLLNLFVIISDNQFCSTLITRCFRYQSLDPRQIGFNITIWCHRENGTFYCILVCRRILQFLAYSKFFDASCIYRLVRYKRYYDHWRAINKCFLNTIHTTMRYKNVRNLKNIK